MVHAVSSSKLLCEIERALQRVAETDVHHYLDEASRCFRAGAYDAAVVMAWSATIAYLRHAANKIGPEVFQYGFCREYGKPPSTPKDLESIDDKTLVQVCKQMRFLRVASEGLHRFRDYRNRSAHPSRYFANRYDVERLLGICLKVVSHPTKYVFILDDTLLIDYALKSKHSAETIVSLVHPNYRMLSAKKVVEAYLSNSGPEYDALVGVWYRIWDLLTEVDRDKLWHKLVEEVIRALKGRNKFRSYEEIARLIVWPDPGQNNRYRDFVARQYIFHLKSKVQDGSFSSEDKEFALWLYDKLPGESQQQIIHLCARWLVGRVKRGDFVGADLDFNSWLKERAEPSQQMRFQIIRDAIVRRY